MNEFKIFDDLYMFSAYVESIPITFNQYLLLGDEPILFHTGNSAQVTELVSKLKSILGDRVYLMYSYLTLRVTNVVA